MRDYIYIQGAPPYSTMPTDNNRRVKRKSKKVRDILSMYFCMHHTAFTLTFYLQISMRKSKCVWWWVNRIGNEAAYQFSWVKWQKKWKIQFELRQSMVSCQSSIRPWCVIFTFPYSEVNMFDLFILKHANAPMVIHLIRNQKMSYEGQ